MFIFTWDHIFIFPLSLGKLGADKVMAVPFQRWKKLRPQVPVHFYFRIGTRVRIV